MVYLLIGKDTAAKEKRIEHFKKELLKSPEAAQFDYESLSSHKLDSDTLKQALDALPVIGQLRLLLIREVELLSPHNKELLQNCLAQKPDHFTLILDAFKADMKLVFFKKMSALAQLEKFDTGYVENVFDMTKAIDARQPAKALKILNGVLTRGEHPLKILGALIWFWGRNKPRLSLQRFQNGLKELQEADWNIKRSRLKPEYTLEILVVKLCSLAQG